MAVGEFMDRLASDAAAPGGGSAAAMAGTMGACLVSMVANLTVGREKFREHEEQVIGILEKTEKLRANLLTAADEDTRAFNKVMEAMKMPKETNEEREKRKQALQKAFKGAAVQPMRIAEMCLQVLELAWELHDKGNPNALSDIGVGALMANAGLEGAIMNVEINLPYIKDKQFCEEMKAKVEEVKKKGNKIFRNILAYVKF